MGQQFGDTTLTKVFVGGLAWETHKEALREHFEKHGEILEAVIISDKITGRSKGYGFVTFKEADAAKKACEDANPTINGRRANCNLATLGAKRSGPRPSPPCSPVPLPSQGHHHPPGMGVGSRGVSPGLPATQWYYPHPSGTPPPPPPPPPPFQLHHYHGAALPFYATSTYGYSPNYMTELGYNGKLSHTGGGGYFHGHGQLPYTSQGGIVAANGVLPIYHPLYHFHHHHSQGMGIPAHFFPPASAAAITTIPAIISKPAAISPPPAVCVAVEQVKGGS